jgi:hypothetical protein
MMKMRLLGMSGIAVAIAATLTMLFGVAGASAALPWWHLSSGSRPSELQPGTRGKVVVTLANVGDAPAGGSAGPVTIADTLPSGLVALSVQGTSVNNAVSANSTASGDGPVKCSLKAKPLITCVFEGSLLFYDQIEVTIGVEVKPEAQVGGGEVNEVAVSGGGAPPVKVSRPLTIGEEPTPFGVEGYELTNEEEGGTLDTQAGSHPFQQTTTITLNQRNSEIEEPASVVKDLAFKWPAGLIGSGVAVPQCTIGQFLAYVIIVGFTKAPACPLRTVVGVAEISYVLPNFTSRGLNRFSTPVYNLAPSFGEPARFGFITAVGPVLIDPAIRGGDGGDYGITVNVPNITDTVDFVSSRVTVWGTPGDPSHDLARGVGCLDAARGENIPCEHLAQAHPPAFLTTPTSCSGAALQTSVTADSWTAPLEQLSFQGVDMPEMDGCNRLSFSPAIAAEASTDRASAPSGLDFNIDFHDEGLTSGEGIAESQLKNVVVTLPEGLTINPSAGVGLGGCTRADYARETISSLPGEGCPNDSKLGTVEVQSPLLPVAVHGSLFIAQPYENPFSEPGHPEGSLVALYVVLKNPENGVLIKLAGRVTPDPVTGRLTTIFENNPQLAFGHFNFHFREGQQAPLISPAACGTYTTQAQLTPWSAPNAPVTDSSTFTITKGFDGGACPSGGVPPFAPQIASGMLNNNAGAFSSFYLHLTRTDGEQEISGFSTNLPAGLTGDLTGIPFCPEAQIALARTKTGGEEEANPSCPAASQVGHTLVGTGVGAVLAYVPGKIYLAGPFHGAPFSIVAITSAVVGPFDLGTVVLRFGLTIDPYTAQVSVTPTSSEPIPTILRGIVTHVRDIRVYIDRQNFTLNPTSCNPLAIGSTLNSNLGASTTITSPFQAASCANLKFAPKFAVSTSGKTSKANGASLAVKLTYPQAPQGTQANITRVKVDLPKRLPSRLTTLQKACTAAQFNTNPAGCPAASFIGHAKAITPLIPVPLEGPAIFVSHGGEAFPSLIMVLQGYGVTIDLVGSTFISKSGITSSTFKTVPDQPIGSFELTLPQGKYSALAANGNLCASTLTMPTEFLAQNGAKINQSTPISVTGCKPAITVKSHKVKGKTATIAVGVPAAGKLMGSGKGVGSSSKTSSGRETVSLTLSQNKGGKLKTSIKLSFTPKSGMKLSKSLTVKFKQ